MDSEDEWKQIREVITPANLERWRGGLANVSQGERSIAAGKNAAILLNSFRKLDADDPDVYSRVIEHVLSRYPVDTQRAAVDASIWKWPPSAYEIREFCERRENQKVIGRKGDDAIAETLSRRAQAWPPR